MCFSFELFSSQTKKTILIKIGTWLPIMQTKTISTCGLHSWYRSWQYSYMRYVTDTHHDNIHKPPSSLAQVSWSQCLWTHRTHVAHSCKHKELSDPTYCPMSRRETQPTCWTFNSDGYFQENILSIINHRRVLKRNQDTTKPMDIRIENQMCNLRHHRKFRAVSRVLKKIGTNEWNSNVTHMRYHMAKHIWKHMFYTCIHTHTYILPYVKQIASSNLLLMTQGTPNWSSVKT